MIRGNSVNSRDKSDQTPHFGFCGACSGFALLSMSHKKDARLILVNISNHFSKCSKQILFYNNAYIKPHFGYCCVIRGNSVNSRDKKMKNYREEPVN